MNFVRYFSLLQLKVIKILIMGTVYYEVLAAVIFMYDWAYLVYLV